ncbi:YihY/virulence factor BrkB family protein [Panacibacter sp. DH6]|uniref:YihY/virulence factor BrkB family protein n=1 Tax=Panacibacter microcysteis TaxID=2793269 RepID=A0A931ME70_9BACT|nr:YihY/virulence factor BrkB family protein [Panacibacter microcysteis]MBG9378114.1 YihY/virulence factor BrkB family protein [Panacibacter microcysteis]
MKKFSLKNLWKVIKLTFKNVGADKLPKLSGSLAYYTVFSMGPLLLLIISIAGIILGREASEGKIYEQLVGFVGQDTASQLQVLVKSASLEGKSTFAAIIGGITLLIGATTVFGEIQDSINMIWGLKPKPKQGLMKMLKNRFLSFSVIVSLGFLLLVSLSVSAVIDAFSERLTISFETGKVVIFYILNLLLTLIITSAIFATIFKVLPDAAIRWKDVRAGAITTAVLFMLGKFAISFYIGQSNVGTTFGAAGSIVVLLVWVYYSSMILYMGAEFTKAYAVVFGAPIHPNAYAVTTRQVEVETGDASVQENENTGSKKTVKQQ